MEVTAKDIVPYLGHIEREVLKRHPQFNHIDIIYDGAGFHVNYGGTGKKPTKKQQSELTQSIADIGYALVQAFGREQ